MKTTVYYVIASLVAVATVSGFAVGREQVTEARRERRSSRLQDAIDLIDSERNRVRNLAESLDSGDSDGDSDDVDQFGSDNLYLPADVAELKDASEEEETGEEDEESDEEEVYVPSDGEIRQLFEAKQSHVDIIDHVADRNELENIFSPADKSDSATVASDLLREADKAELNSIFGQEPAVKGKAEVILSSPTDTNGRPANVSTEKISMQWETEGKGEGGHVAKMKKRSQELEEFGANPRPATSAATTAASELLSKGVAMAGANWEARKLVEEKIGALRDERQRTITRLLYDETRHLVKALDYATKAQAERTDRYVGPQVKQIRQAIAIEQALHDIGDDNGRLLLSKRLAAEAAPDDDTSEEGDEDEAEEQDSSAVISDSDEEEEDGEDGEDEEDEEDEEEEEVDRAQARRYMDGLLTLAARAVIEKKLSEAQRMYTKMTKRQGEQEMRERMLKHQIVDYIEAIHEARAERDDEEDSDEDSSSYDENNAKGMYLNPFLRDFVEGFRQRQGDRTGALPAVKRQVGDDGSEESSEETEDVAESYEQACPAVARLVDDCQFAVDLHLELDDDAMELCNRHQLCYSCGADMGSNAASCDSTYLHQAKRLCEAEGDWEECDKQASALYDLMRLYHVFVPDRLTSHSCRAPCTLQYLTGRA